MCNVNSVGLGIQGLGFMSDTFYNLRASQQADAYQTYKEQAIWDDYVKNSKALKNAYSKEQLNNAQERQQLHLQNLQNKSLMQAKIASSGLTGNSISSLYQGYDRAAAYNDYISEKNLYDRGLEYNNRLMNLQYPTLNSLNMNNQQYKYTKTQSIFKGISDFANNYGKISAKISKNQKNETNQTGNFL